jgi:hypothetical protein
MAVATLVTSPLTLPLHERCCAPELLDVLPPQAPEAHISRRELQQLNTLMSTPAWFERTLRRTAHRNTRSLEVGAGDGALAHRLASLVHLDGLDRVPRPHDFPTGHGWHQLDVRAFRNWQDYAIVIGNLVWHHFSDGDLCRIGAALAPHAQLFLASEPHRSAWARWLFQASARLLRLSLVTRHDGAVSIAAGFRGDELPRLLGLAPRQWRCRVTLTARGAYRLTAQKIP